MAITKADLVFQSSVSNAAGATTTGASIDLTASYAAAVNVRITNGATGPSVACHCTVQVSNDGVDWYDYRQVFGTTTANEVTETSVDIPIGHQFVRTVFTGNTGQAVTVEADGSSVTGV